ncbi:unnamed protein product [Schistosoma turkestanicum]|nr:unnamed protein product [Schistosoma turkestanicum]CAH8539837.1 unnamed protein product [Schistosoma turkestanicum]
MLSFSAYKKDIMRNSDDSLDEQKSFFEAIARTMCNGYSHDFIQHMSNSRDENYKFSLNEILKHSEEFSKTYQCPLGSEMNPVDKCIL